MEAARGLECCVRSYRLRAARVAELRGNVKAVLIDQRDRLLVEPLHAFTVLPEPVLHRALIPVRVGAQTVLFALVPPAVVLASVSPVVHSVPFFLVLVVLAIVTHPVRIDVDAGAVHVVVLPLAVVLATVFPQVNAVAVDFIVSPLAFICASIGPDVLSDSFLLRHHIVALVLGAFRPGLKSFAVLLVISPVAFVPRTFAVSVNAVTVCFVVGPLAVVGVSISVVELSIPASLIIRPLTFVPRTVWPHHLPKSVPEPSKPLALVLGTGTIVKNILTDFLLSVKLASQTLIRLFGLEVLRSDI